MARKTSENVSEPSAEQVKPEKRFIVLPFVHRNAEDFGMRLKKLVKVNYPQVDFNVAFKAPKTIGELFPFKDNVKNTEDKPLVVYKIKCKECGAEYIGKTESMLCHRIKEHQKKKIPFAISMSRRIQDIKLITKTLKSSIRQAPISN
jgi:hypothetical protein